MFHQVKTSKIIVIITKIAKGENVSISERIFVEQLAKTHPDIHNQLNKAQCIRRSKENHGEELSTFLGSLALNGTFKNQHYNPKKENIAELFSNAPEWLRRS